MIGRSGLRFPLWVAAAVVAAAYLLRSLVVRDGDFSLNGVDILALVLVVAAIAVVALLRRRTPQDAEKPPPGERHDEDHRSSQDR